RRELFYILQIIVPKRGDLGGFGITGVNDHTILEAQTFAHLQSQTAILRLILGKDAQAKRIRREETIASRVPARARPIRRVVENRDADFLSLDLAGVVHPVRRLAPYGLFACGALSVD